MEASIKSTTQDQACVQIYVGRPVILHGDNSHPGNILAITPDGALVECEDGTIRGGDWKHVDLLIEGDDLSPQPATPTDPRDYSVNNEHQIVHGDGVAFGVEAQIGARVMDGDGPTGIIVGLTDQLVVYKDDDTGRELAQRYGFCSATLKPPANLPASKPGRLTPRDLVRVGQEVHCEDSPGSGSWGDYEVLDVDDLGVTFLYKPYKGEPEERTAPWTAVKLYPGEVLKALA